MNAELQNRQNEIVEEFAFFEDWMEKYEHVIELGKELEALPEEEKTRRSIDSRVSVPGMVDRFKRRQRRSVVSGRQ